jgi:hypothetical protein
MSEYWSRALKSFFEETAFLYAEPIALAARCVVTFVAPD